MITTHLIFFFFNADAGGGPPPAPIIVSRFVRGLLVAPGKLVR
jgi:hypothetical protein